MKKILAFLGIGFSPEAVGIIIGLIVAAALGGILLGWHEKGLRCDADKLTALSEGVDNHLKDEGASQQAGKDTEHAKQNAGAAMDMVAVKPTAGVFTADSVRTQSDLIAAGESALKRQY